MIKVYCDINGTYECFDGDKEKQQKIFVKLLNDVAKISNETISFSFCSSCSDDDIKIFTKELLSLISNTNIKIDDPIKRPNKYANMLDDIDNNFKYYSQVFYFDDNYELVTHFLLYMKDHYSLIKAIGFVPSYYGDDSYFNSSMLPNLKGVNECLSKFLGQSKD